MKFLTPLLCLLFAQGIAIAEEPAELSERRQAWETQRTEAQANVDKLYFEELEQLKKNFTQASNITDALAVDNVIKGSDKADNEPVELTKVRLARDKSLKKILKPLDKRYWQDLKKLKEGFIKEGKLDGVVIADAEIEKVLATYKQHAPKPKPKRRTVAVDEHQGWAGINHSNNVYEFELAESIKGAVAKIWVGESIKDAARSATIDSNGLLIVVDPDGKKTIAYQWTEKQIEEARHNSANPNFKDAYLIQFDAEQTIKAKGNYKIIFKYESGKKALRIEKVEITELSM
jgi:hypothetical protein